MAFTTHYGTMVVWRSIAGFAGACTFVSGGVLVATLTQDPRKSAAALAIYFCGISFAMLAAGLVLPSWFAARGDQSWPSAWVAMALGALLSAFLASWASRRVAPDAGSAVGARGSVPWSRLIPLVACYFSFGLGFVGYMTFIIAWLRTKSATPLETSFIWSLLSIMAALAPIWWRGPLERWSGATVLAISTMLTGVGAALLLADDSMWMLAASATVFGGAFLITPAAVTAFGKASLPATAWGALVAGFTVAFAIGQIVGPLMTGWLADRYGSLGVGLAVSAAILIAGGALGFLQPAIRR
jgi:MFS family permease